MSCSETTVRNRLLQNRKILESGCWIWTGGLYRNGYGRILIKGKRTSVHRLSLEIFKGIIYKNKEQANHKKECPDKRCFNPEHLYVGTQSDNMKDLHYSENCKVCGKKKIYGKRCKNCKRIYMNTYCKAYSKRRILERKSQGGEIGSTRRS